MGMREQWVRIFPNRLRRILGHLDIEDDKIQEIRLRVYQPLMIRYCNELFLVSADSHIVRHISEGVKHVRVSPEDIKETMALVSEYSIYAYEEEMRQGFITIKGGHRVGISGKVILESDRVKTMQNITFMNIRLAHQIKGCADCVIPYVFENQRFRNTLIISPPCCGKTTLLRDIIRQVSIAGQTVGVVDERSEIAACYLGIPQNDLGMYTDVLDGCPKAEGMMIMIRAMSPQMIAVDEIGTLKDVQAVVSALYCGCRVLATIHGNSMEDLLNKPIFDGLVREKVFERYIILNNDGMIGNVEAIYNESGTNLFYS